MTRYTVQIIVEVTDTMGREEPAYEWNDVARRVVNRVANGSRKPLDRDARLRIQGVKLDSTRDE